MSSIQYVTNYLFIVGCANQNLFQKVEIHYYITCHDIVLIHTNTFPKLAFGCKCPTNILMAASTKGDTVLLIHWDPNDGWDAKTVTRSVPIFVDGIRQHN